MISYKLQERYVLTTGLCDLVCNDAILQTPEYLRGATMRLPMDLK